MCYYFSTSYEEKGDVVLTHSALEEFYGANIVRFRFERHREGESSFDFAEGALPSWEFNKCYGFSEDELFQLRDYLKNNAMFIWEFAQKGGGENCLKS